VIPYEWFEREEIKDEKTKGEKFQDKKIERETKHWMLVLWLNQEAFETTPLSSLQEVGNLFVAHLRNKKTPNRKVDVKILGPVDSGVLTPLARDIASKTWGSAQALI
jgi:hypothetical protein